MTVSIIIPVYNEETNLHNLYHELSKLFKQREVMEIIFVDDGSYDNSFEIIKELHKKDKRVTGIRLKKNYGQISAILTGIDLANSDFVITMDADLQYSPEEVPKFINKMKEGNSVILGYRIRRKDPLFRKVGSFIFWRLIGSKNRKIKDPGCGFNAFKTELIKKIIAEYGKGIKNIKRVVKNGIDSIIQIPITHFPRKRGKSRYNFFYLLLYGYLFLKEIYCKNFDKNLIIEIDEILRWED